MERPWRVGGILALLCLIWGSTWLVIRVGLVDLPPFTAAAVRFALAAAAMTLVAPRLARAEGGERPGVLLALVVGCLNFGVSYAAVYLAEEDLPSGLASCLWATYPMMIAAAGHVFLPGERLNLAQVIGFLVGFAGVVLLFATDVRDVGPRAPLAACILLVSPLSSTVGTTWLKLHGARTSSVLLNRNAMWVGATLLCAGAFALERDAPVVWSGRALATVVFLALVATALAFGLYFHLLRSHAAHRLSLISYVTPVLALGFGWAFADERLTATKVAGTALILLGVALVLRGRDRQH